MTDPSSASLRVLELAEDFLERYRRGERPDVEDYVARHPELAGEIREVFSGMAMMERIVPDDPLVTDHASPAAGAGPSHRLKQLGDYRILREIGRGGMGVVYEAEQLSLGRLVALKVLPERLLRDPKQRRRFEREARAAARLHHTNIVPVYGVGEHDGTPYYAMQFIPGHGLDQVLDELRRLRALPEPEAELARPTEGPPAAVTATLFARSLLEGRLNPPASDAPGGSTRPIDPLSSASPKRADEPSADSPAESTHISSSASLLGQSSGSGSDAHGSRRPTYFLAVARIGVQVADALAYAHAERVLHRDIKPSNLLLDARGTAWITDFGLAKLEDHEALTNTGDILGTLRYMPPEGLEGKHDARGDIYSLGLTLYELLAFRPAFDETDRGRLVRLLSGEGPPRLRTLNPDVPRDLETVVHKAIDREPSHRYASAADLADDLRRYVEDRPVLARRSSEVEKLRRWCRRNPAPAGLMAALFLVFWAGFGLVTWKWREAVDERGKSVFAESQALASASRAEAERGKASEAADRAEAERGKASEAADRAARSLYYSQIARARLEYQANNITEAEALLDGCDPARRGWEWNFLKGLVHAELFLFPEEDGGWVERVACSPDGRLIAVAGGGDPYYHGRGPSAIRPGHVTLRDAETGRTVHTLTGHSHLVVNVAFSPDSRVVATASLDGTVRLHDVVTGGLIRTFAGAKQASKLAIWVEAGTALAFSPDGSRLAIGMDDGTLAVFDLASGVKVLTLPKTKELCDGYERVAFSRNGRWIATISGRATLPSAGSIAKIWDAATGAEGARIEPKAQRFDLAFSPDSNLLACAEVDGKVTIWDPRDGTLLRTFHGTNATIRAVAFSPDGMSIAYGGDESTVRVATLGVPHERIFRGHMSLINALAFSADGHRLVSGSRDGTARTWDLASDPEVGFISRLGQRSGDHMVGYAAGGREVLVACSQGEVIRRESGTGVLDELDGLDTAYDFVVPGSQLELDTEGRHAIVVPSNDRATALCISLEGDRRRVALRGHRRPIRWARISGDGTRAVTAAMGTASLPPYVIAWDATSGTPSFRWEPGRDQPRAVALDPAGRLLAVAGVHAGPDAEVYDPVGGAFLAVFDVATGREVFRKEGLSTTCMAVGFSPDGGRVAAACLDRSLGIWELPSGRPVVSSTQGPEMPFDLTFSPDGRRLVLAARLQVSLMDAETGDSVLILKGIAQQIPHTIAYNATARFSPDGAKILAVTSPFSDGTSEWAAESAIADPAARLRVSRRRRDARRLLMAHQGSEAAGDLSPWARDFALAELARIELETPREFILRGHDLACAGRLDEAEADFARAAALLPGDDRVVYEAACALGDAGQLERAGRWYERLAGRTPYRIIGRPAWEWYREVTLRLMAGDEPGFRAMAREMVLRCGRDPIGAESLARVCVLRPGVLDDPAEVVRLARAGRDSQEASNDRERKGRVRHALGLALERAGDSEEAVRTYRECLNLWPDGLQGATCRARLATSLARLGRLDEARAILGESIRWDEPPFAPVYDGDRVRARLTERWELAMAQAEAGALLADAAFPADPFAR